MSEPSWAELMGRHAASATLHVSGVMTYLNADEQRQQFLWWHGPASQWRIARSDGTVVYLRDTAGRSYQRNSGNEIQELGGRIAVPILGPVSPLDAIAPGSLLNNMTDHAAVAAGPLPTDVDGRRAWRVTLSAAGADMFMDIDDDTGILVQAQGADYPEPAFTITDLQTDDHRDAAWFAP